MNEQTFTNHNVDNEDDKCYYSSTTSMISPELKLAEQKLQDVGYRVIRHVKNNSVFGLEVFGQNFHDLEKVRSVLGAEYRYTLNPNMMQILIK